jgi:hypothetical protein
MTETLAAPLPQRRRFHFDWILPAFLRPRRLFTQVKESEGDSWLTPVLVLTLAELGRVVTAGWLRQSAAASGEVSLPDGFDFWTPEQQAQFFQAQQATTGPAFVYIFPAIASLLGLWITWLLIASLLHLVLTLLGGRSQTRSAINFVAWALLPLAVRSVVSLGYMLFTQKLIVGYGLAGFAPNDETMLSAFLKEVLSFVDIYLLWAVALTALGAAMIASLPTRKALGGVLMTMSIVLALHALPGFIGSQITGLQVIPIF